MTYKQGIEKLSYNIVLAGLSIVKTIRFRVEFIVTRMNLWFIWNEYLLVVFQFIYLLKNQHGFVYNKTCKT